MHDQEGGAVEASEQASVKKMSDDRECEDPEKLSSRDELALRVLRRDWGEAYEIAV